MSIQFDPKGVSTGDWAHALGEAAQRKGKSEGTRKVKVGNNRAQQMSMEQVRVCTEAILEDSSKASYTELRDLRSSFEALKGKDQQECNKLLGTFSSRLHRWKQKNKGWSKLAAVVSLGTIYLVDHKGRANETRAQRMKGLLGVHDEMIKKVEYEVAKRMQQLNAQVQKRSTSTPEERVCLLRDIGEVYSFKAQTPQLDGAMEKWQKELCQSLQPETFSRLNVDERKQVLIEANIGVLASYRPLRIALLQEELKVLDQARNYSQLGETEQQHVRDLLPLVGLEETVSVEELGQDSTSSVLARGQLLRKKMLRDNGVKLSITVPSDEEVRRICFSQDFIGTQLFAREVPPTDSSVDLCNILVDAFISVVHLLPERIQDDRGTQSLANTQKYLEAKLRMANRPDEYPGYGRSKNALSQLALHVQNRKNEIDQEADSECKEQLQNALNTDLVQIFRDQLGAAVHHCPDRLQLAAEQIYFERIAQVDISRDLSLANKLQRKVAGTREDIFREVCVKIAQDSPYELDESSFAQSALELLGKKADIPQTNTQQSTYTQVFARVVHLYEKRILAEYRAAYTPAAALGILADEVTYADMQTFFEERFDGLYEMKDDDEDGSSAPIMQLVTEQGKANQRGLALLMQETGMVRPFV